MDDRFNMAMRKYLKQVGVTSQKAIEEAMAGAEAGRSYAIRTVVTIDGLDMEHVVEGSLEAPAE